MLKVGSKVVHIECYGGGGRRLIRDGRIVRETLTRWVDDIGTHWNKATLAKVPQYKPGPRYIVAAENFDAAVMS